MMQDFLTVSLRQGALWVPVVDTPTTFKQIRPTVSVLVANLDKLGFAVDEPLLHALNTSTPSFQSKVLHHARTVMGMDKNWTPLVKGWDTPTSETLMDHMLTLFHNAFGSKISTGGTRLPCGHIIPPNTFPLDRYNGCPFCGTPFEQGHIEYLGQGSQKRLLSLWCQTDLEHYLQDLLTAKTALDATQVDNLKRLLLHLSLPEVAIEMKETKMLVIDVLVDNDRAIEAQGLLETPVDVMRYLWYQKTGFLQIVEPKTIKTRIAKNQTNIIQKLTGAAWNGNEAAKTVAEKALKLRYNRRMCRIVANWLNNMELPAKTMASAMHPKREMWVRFIRALRLSEYSKRQGMDHLAAVLDRFYRKDYPVWQGQVDQARMRPDSNRAFVLLKQRPGAFARALFANMLWFGGEPTLQAFEEVMDQVPARLLFTLNSYAKHYFDPSKNRAVRPLGGVTKVIPNNQLLDLYTPEQLQQMQEGVEKLCLLTMEKRFAAQATESKTIYIDPLLYKLPVAIGDRTGAVQDLPSVLMGTRFPVEGDVVRLFMEWGQGLPAQHLDMDLSCHVAYADRAELCSYSRLVIHGAKHSGDIQCIPNQVGTAEYIDIDTTVLREKGAQYVVFTCNAFSNGNLLPNLVVGWMNSQHPMKISTQTGVAYDPSCVQHQARIQRSLTKGLVFGVLDLKAHEIVWLELEFQGQVVQQLNISGVEALLDQLENKLNIGALLALKAKAQGLEVVDHHDPEAPADEVYLPEWARNAAAVTQLLLD